MFHIYIDSSCTYVRPICQVSVTGPLVLWFVNDVSSGTVVTMFCVKIIVCSVKVVDWFLRTFFFKSVLEISQNYIMIFFMARRTKLVGHSFFEYFSLICPFR